MKKLIDFGVDYCESEVENGVKLHSFYKPNSPIYFRVFFYAGSQFDGDKPGLAHFCEHIFLAGTEKYPTKDLVNEKVQEIGGTKNAFTSKNNLWLTLDLANKADLQEMFDVVDQILNYSLYNVAEIELERKAVLAEQTRKVSNPSLYIFDLSSLLLFQGTNLENPVLGFDESVKNISQQDLLNYRDKYLVNGQVAYFISGDFDEKVVIDSLKKINNSRKSINIPTEQLAIITTKKELIKTLSNLEQNYLCLGARLSPFQEKSDIVASNIFNTILGQGNTSRLYKVLRGGKGLVYDVNSSINNNSWYTSFSINTNCKVKDTSEVISLIKEEFKNIVENGVNDKELEQAKKNILRNIKFRSETAGFWVEMPVMLELTGKKEPMLPDEYVELVKSVTVENVNSFIQKYLSGKELLLAGVGDFNK